MKLGDKVTLDSSNSKDPKPIFVVGHVGVYWMANGKDWNRILSTEAIPSHPRAAFFDESNRSLYIAMEVRGIICFDGIP